MKDIVMGRAKRYRDITVFPLHREATPRFDYMALDEVLHQAFFLLEDEVDPRRWRRLSRRAKLSQLWDSPQFPEGP